jgi:hypothetical protein
MNDFKIIADSYRQLADSFEALVMAYRILANQADEIASKQNVEPDDIKFFFRELNTVQQMHVDAERGVSKTASETKFKLDHTLKN